MKHKIHLHPVVILVAVTAGTLAAGIAGAFVAVPLTAVAYRAITVAHGHTYDSPTTKPAAQPSSG